MMKSIVFGLFAIIAMNFGFTESKTSVSEGVLENAEALGIESIPVVCSTCSGNDYHGCTEVYMNGGEVIVVGCEGEKTNDVEE